MTNKQIDTKHLTDELLRFAESLGGSDSLIRLSPSAFTEGGEEVAIKLWGKQYKDIESFVRDLALSWEKGKSAFLDGELADALGAYSPALAARCRETAQQKTLTGESEDILFFRLLYSLCPTLGDLYWKGDRYASLALLGTKLYMGLEGGDANALSYADGILKNKVVSEYISQCKLPETDVSRRIKDLEKAWADGERTEREAKLSAYLLCFLLTGDPVFDVKTGAMRRLTELRDYMKSLLSRSYEEFEDFCHYLIDYEDNLEPRFEAWLIAIGKEAELSAWKSDLKV